MIVPVIAPVVIGAVLPPGPALTASVLDTPESHDGDGVFRFELKLSEEPKTGFSYKILRDDGAFTVTGGTVSGVRRLDPPGNIRWEISINPDSTDDVTVKLPATESCAALGAICTSNKRMLSSPVEFSVAGPEPEELTASFESVPETHNGSDKFKFSIAFSGELKTGFSYKTLRDNDAFTVTGGTVSGVRRLDPPGNIRWEISVRPNSNGNVTVVLPVTTDCDARGAICANDDIELSNRLGAHRERAGPVAANRNVTNPGVNTGGRRTVQKPQRPTARRCRLLDRTLAAIVQLSGVGRRGRRGCACLIVFGTPSDGG